MFRATNNKTGEQSELSEAQVRAEVIDTLQHDMSASLEHTDDEIAAAVNAGKLSDYFDRDAFEGYNFDITITTV
jgi:hypothetical protein